jgi:hypothetical protein
MRYALRRSIPLNPRGKMPVPKVAVIARCGSMVIPGFRGCRSGVNQ